MSLDTLLEAAKYLEHIENGDGVSINTNECDIKYGQFMIDDGSLTDEHASGDKYHLKVDPNVPISVQFHTYSSMGVMAHAFDHTSSVTQSTKRNAHQSGQLMNTLGRPSMRGGNTNNRDKDHSSYSRHREMHKTLEKNRRAHLRHCFEILKEVLPLNEYNEKKTSHINIIRCAIRCIQQLKRAESEYAHEIERLTRARITLQNQLKQLKEEINDSVHRKIDVEEFLRNTTIVFEAKHKPKTSTLEILEYDGEIDEQSDGDVIIELDAGEDFDDETTTTASECAEDLRDNATASKLNGSLTANALLYQCHA